MASVCMAPLFLAARQPTAHTTNIPPSPDSSIMGSCWNTPLPPESEYIKKRLQSYGIAPSLPQPSSKSLGTSFNKEEGQLRDLLTALRTGLLFSPTQFSLMPGVATTGQVSFTLGNSELHKLMVDDDSSDEELPEAVVLNEDEPNEQQNTNECYSLQITLKGRYCFNELTMKLVVKPAVGPFTGKKVVFLWSDNTLRARGCEGVNAQCLPLEFNNEAHFCSCCLLLLYQPSSSNEDESEGSLEASGSEQVVSLRDQAYRTAVCNLDLVSDLYTIPSKLYHKLFGSQPPLIIAVRLWPGTMADQFNATSTMRVKSHILFAEFTCLLRGHFGISSTYMLKLYHDFKLVSSTELLTEKHHQLDCFVIESADQSGLGYDLEEEPFDSNVTLVTSLVGVSMMNVEADLEMTMRDFDNLLRNGFDLKKDSFLLIVSEDDYSPQYTSDDNWPCTYPFAVPDSSLSAGLRRSFRKLSEKRAGASRLTQSQRFNRSQTETSSSLAPHMTSVVKLLSSSNRQFPSNSHRYSLNIKELHGSMPLYKLSLSQCGLHPYSIVKVFEVTGPAIPITVRQLTYHQQPADQTTTSLANIMDINPSWSLSTLIQYVDTIISPGAVTGHSRLSLRHHRLDELSAEREWAETVGGLLDRWAPAWWGEGRQSLSSRYIDPVEFLIIEKY